ncbi:ankyrin [Aspergillus sclerotioniger CBS 115572]|uniref:Ankyrin n=1 Tax=Aspergillus sclerotioniger CBS 115572 TaxID=1450535 RepID=A0A317W2K2_9EURO|nr:ankyrin [Aspergillus sclerotioniger CBS 115572]PWY80814.1 ankyrin [Aspergillus sclerotioniger CBS 115572]
MTTLVFHYYYQQYTYSYIMAVPRYLLDPPTFKYLLDSLPLECVLKYRLVCRALDYAIFDYLYGKRNLITRPIQPGNGLLRHKLDRDPFFNEHVKDAMKFMDLYTHPLLTIRSCTRDMFLDAATTAIMTYKGRPWAESSLTENLVWYKADNEFFTVVMAAWLQQTDVVEQWLWAGHSAHARHPILGSLVYAAAYNDDIELMQLLIRRGANVMRVEGYFGDAFKVAAHRGSQRVLELFLETKQYYNITDMSSRGVFACPLSAAAAAGLSQSVTALLPFRWNRYICSGTLDRSPLYIAAHEGWVSIVYMLLDCSDIDPNSGRWNVDTPLAVALDKGHKGVVRVLMADRRVRVLPSQRLDIQRVLFGGDD